MDWKRANLVKGFLLHLILIEHTTGLQSNKFAFFQPLQKNLQKHRNKIEIFFSSFVCFVGLCVSIIRIIFIFFHFSIYHYQYIWIAVKFSLLACLISYFDLFINPNNYSFLLSFFDSCSGIFFDFLHYIWKKLAMMIQRIGLVTAKRSVACTLCQLQAKMQRFITAIKSCRIMDYIQRRRI